MEDKAGTPPRECRELREAINDVRAALKHGDKRLIASALETLERDHSRANKAHILLSSLSGPMAHLQAFSDAINDALEARARAIIAINRS